jgi:hypothetical protein
MPNVASEVAKTQAVLVWDNRKRPEQSVRGTTLESAVGNMTDIPSPSTTEVKLEFSTVTAVKSVEALSESPWCIFQTFKRRLQLVEATP